MLESIATILALIAGIIASLGLIWLKGVKPIVTALRRLHCIFEKLMEYDDRLRVIEHNSYQLTNNGGSHMKDAIDRIEAKLDSEVLNLYKLVTNIQIQAASRQDD